MESWTLLPCIHDGFAGFVRSDLAAWLGRFHRGNLQILALFDVENGVMRENKGSPVAFLSTDIGLRVLGLAASKLLVKDDLNSLFTLSHVAFEVEGLFEREPKKESCKGWTKAA